MSYTVEAVLNGLSRGQAFYIKPDTTYPYVREVIAEAMKSSATFIGRPGGVLRICWDDESWGYDIHIEEGITDVKPFADGGSITDSELLGELTKITEERGGV